MVESGIASRVPGAAMAACHGHHNHRPVWKLSVNRKAFTRSTIVGLHGNVPVLCASDGLEGASMSPPFMVSSCQQRVKPA